MAAVEAISKPSAHETRSDEKHNKRGAPRPRSQLPDIASSSLLQQLLRQSQTGMLGNQMLHQTSPALAHLATSYQLPAALPYQSTPSYPIAQPGLSWHAQMLGLQAWNQPSTLAALLNLQSSAPPMNAGLLLGRGQPLAPLLGPHAAPVGPPLAVPSHLPGVPVEVAPPPPMRAPLTVRAKVRRRYRHESFPEKLYRLLAEAEAQGQDDIIGFVSDGAAIAIHKPEALAAELVPRYFRHKKLSSFMRQLSMYGFQRVATRSSDNTFEHPLFRKGQPELCRQMKRMSELEVVHVSRGY